MVATAVIAVVLLAAGTVAWATSDAAATQSHPATDPVPEAPAPAGVPAGFVESWRAPSPQTTGPVVSGGIPVTADGGVLTGRDPVSGAEAWSYGRDLPLCALGAGFAPSDRVLALYAGSGEFCSELTALDPATGERLAAGNPDARAGARLLAAGSSVAAASGTYVEVLRSDLVRTLEYGDVPTPAQAGRQPRPQCTHTSTALAIGRIGVVERCPGEPSDRLTVVDPDGPAAADEPQEEFSVPLAGSGAVLVAISPERVAVALPGPPRLVVFDRTGLEVEQVELPAGSVVDPAGGVANTVVDEDRVHWWTGRSTIALNGVALAPEWTVANTLGPAVPYGDVLLAPVRDGLVVLDPASGDVQARIPVRRAEPAAPVRLATAGEVLLEQRGAEVVALLPT